MTKNENLSNEMKMGHELTYAILSSITEHSVAIEKALINTLFKTLTTHQDIDTIPEEMDSLYLLWTILQDAKTLRKVKEEIVSVKEPEMN